MDENKNTNPDINPGVPKSPALGKKLYSVKDLKKSDRIVPRAATSPLSPKALAEEIKAATEEIKPVPVAEETKEEEKKVSFFPEVPEEKSAEKEETETEEEISESEEINEEAEEKEETEENKEKEENKEETEIKLNRRASFFDTVKAFIASLIIIVFTFTFLISGVGVSGDSMNDTLQDKDYLFMSKLFYTPKTGDIVVLHAPNYENERHLIKRVIATGGQKVKIDFDNWEVTVDGVLLDEDYVLKQYSPIMNCEDLKVDENNCAEFTVDEGKVFVMGDNRNNSLDSRSNSIGQVEKSYIIGKVLFRLFPLGSFGTV